MSFAQMRLWERLWPCLVLVLAAVALSCLPSFARDQWSINHGGNNPPVDPRFMPGGAYSGYVPMGAPSFGTDFWKGQLANTIPAGTVLTVILEDDLSSLKNRQGDTFAMTMDDGFSLNGKVLIPPKSKILGTVMSATSAKMQRNGSPGNLEISLQTLVFPDGSHYPIFGFVDGNPNSKAKARPKVRNAGVAISDYGDSLKGMAMSFISGPGYMMKKINRGNEFMLDRGDALPIRLTRSLEVKPPSPASLIAQPPTSFPGATASSGSSSVPGLIDPQGPVQIPGFIPAGQGAPQTIPGTMPPSAPPINNANDVFNQPLAPRTLGDMPDPF